MPWIKGTPRKGHINKDGTKHAAHGARIKQPKIVKVAKAVARRTFSAIRREVTPERRENIDAIKAIHGEGSRPIIEPCPNCSFAYADGGYCPSCGWSLPIPRRKS